MCMIFLFGFVSGIKQIYVNYYTEIHKGRAEIHKEIIYLRKKTREIILAPIFKRSLRARNDKMIEIERKFLVTSEAFKKEAYTQNRIAQGYLSSVPERTVRVRIKGDKGFLTVKGATNDSGVSRFEWEIGIPIDEATALLKLCEKGVIDKTRFEVKIGQHIFEVDEFYGDNDSLIVAEIELKSETETFEKPDWLGKEVTNDNRYYNSFLSKNPYGNWL